MNNLFLFFTNEAITPGNVEKFVEDIKWAESNFKFVPTSLGALKNAIAMPYTNVQFRTELIKFRDENQDGFAAFSFTKIIPKSNIKKGVRTNWKFETYICLAFLDKGDALKFKLGKKQLWLQKASYNYTYIVNQKPKYSKY